MICVPLVTIGLAQLNQEPMTKVILLSSETIEASKRLPSLEEYIRKYYTIEYDTRYTIKQKAFATTLSIHKSLFTTTQNKQKNYSVHSLAPFLFSKNLINGLSVVYKNNTR